MNKKLEMIVNAIESKKGRDIIVYDLEGRSSISDYYVICTGSSNVNIQAISDEVEREMDMQHEKRLGIEGYREATWILLDYDDVLIHIFNAETRENYDFEEFLKDSKEVLRK